MNFLKFGPKLLKFFQFAKDFLVQPKFSFIIKLQSNSLRQVRNMNYFKFSYKAEHFRYQRSKMYSQALYFLITSFDNILSGLARGAPPSLCSCLFFSSQQLTKCGIWWRTQLVWAALPSPLMVGSSGTFFRKMSRLLLKSLTFSEVIFRISEAPWSSTGRFLRFCYIRA